MAKQVNNGTPPSKPAVGAPGASAFHHLPVMCDEVLEVLGSGPSGIVLDATVGGGGHAAAILAANPDISLLGLDCDDAALTAAAERLEQFGDRVVLHRSAFGDLAGAMGAAGVASISGFLFDLGVSSPQLDWAERGFSYREAGPLDMRMDRRQRLTAAEVVNGYEEAELARILYRNADERHARRIARTVVAARPVADTARLAELVREAIPAPARRRGGHPAKRTFQAIRIEVNGELDQLAGALDEAVRRLVPGGMGVVLSYHSGEDRIVKERFDRAATGGCACPPRLPCACGATPIAILARRAGRTPVVDEATSNPRAASARLRSLERIAGTVDPR
ncbi:MAG: 16S rRNA (cytosine(1402)-N(4))-methyltransferase RsmH [Acidimicrobiales bacterium]|nr:16S rRNA (cytosine(1402)-N(4))-methyltransferase RsmH [Acidimicrobiales bacterium]